MNKENKNIDDKNSLEIGGVIRKVRDWSYEGGGSYSDTVYE